MIRKRIVLVFIVGSFFIQNSLSLPDSSSSESGEKQQTLNKEPVGEFTKQLNQTKEKVGETDPCLEEKRVGPCKAAIPRYYFNKETGKCERFIFGGCGANKNNFKGLGECESQCAKHFPIASTLAVSTHEEKGETICSLPPKKPQSAECLAFFTRYHYNASLGQCVEYIYGGCGATQNNFKSLQACEDTCGNYNGSKVTGGIGKAQTLSLPVPPKPPKPLTKDVCNLPSASGSCYAYMERYFFNAKSNRCEPFVFGGCGGNGNNFKEAEECVRVCGGDSPKSLACLGTECPWEFYSHYTTLGCKPVYDGDACCPTRFDCPDSSQQTLNNTLGEGRSLELPESQCQYKGKHYKVGEDVVEASDTGSCRAACICSESLGKARIMCASIECPEHFGLSTEKRDCVPLYRRGSCCAHDSYCPNDTLVVIEPEQPKLEVKPVFKCNVEGESYYEGQRFYPKNESCLKCICGVGFNGTLSDEFCEPIDCGIEIYYSHLLEKGCAPVYYQSPEGSTRCCPISWECPNDETDKGSTTTPPTTTLVGTVPVTEPTLQVLPTTVHPSRNKSRPLLLTQEACELPKEIGNCKGSRPRYFYNKEANVCEEFAFSGCKGNDNNFVSIRDCQRLCIVADASRSNSSDSEPLSRSRNLKERENGGRAIYTSEVDPCTQPKRTGNCKAYFPRYFYSPEDNSCKSFVFGGCRGNANNFYSKEACQASCMRSSNIGDLRASLPSPSREGDASRVRFNDGDGYLPENVCSLPKKTGFCRAYVTRYHYDPNEKECKDFVYGGCRGNANNFKTKEACEARCASQSGSETEPETAPVSVSVRESSRDSAGSETETAKPKGEGSSRLEKCRLPMKAGSCLGAKPVYYFDAETEECKLFLYSGCFGNANRFSSQADCESECKGKNVGESGGSGRMAIAGLPWRQDRIAKPKSENEDEESQSAPEPSLKSRAGPNPSPSQEKEKPILPPTPEEAKEICKLPAVQGPCRAHILRFAWDAESDQCIPFVYSGCRGNRNNFVTESDCLSACRGEPTIEELDSEGVLSCTFGNELLPIGATVKGHKRNKKWNSEKEEKEVPCGETVCECLTPPSVTCYQTGCPVPQRNGTERVCPTPSCAANCVESIGLDGCPTCDCDDTISLQQVQEALKE